MRTIRLRSYLPLLLLTLSLAVLPACKSPNLAAGGGYAPVTTNSVGEVVPASAPDKALYLADASYKLAYDTMAGAFKFERDNREEILKISPEVKKALDNLRPNVVEVERRWALARKAYRQNPTPAGLSTIQSILAEIQRFVPVVQSQLAPVYAGLTKPQ